MSRNYFIYWSITIEVLVIDHNDKYNIFKIVNSEFFNSYPQVVAKISDDLIERS